MTIKYGELTEAAQARARLIRNNGGQPVARPVGRGYQVEAHPKTTVNHDKWLQIVFPENTDEPEPAEPESIEVEPATEAGFELVPLELIDPNPYQPRQSQDVAALESLARGLRLKRAQLPATCGLMQVPIARPVDGRYELAFGHRRRDAFRLNQEQHGDDWRLMPLRVVALDNEQMYDYAARENGDREDINPIEKAVSIKRAMDELGWDLTRAANAHGLSKSAGSNLTRLLQLPTATQQMIAAGEMSQRHGRELVRLVQAGMDEAEFVDFLQFPLAWGDGADNYTDLSITEATEAVTLQIEKFERDARREPRYCRTCGTEREFTGTEIDRGKAVDCPGCGYNGPPNMWLRSPRRCADCGKVLTGEENIEQRHATTYRCGMCQEQQAAERLFCPICRDDTVTQRTRTLQCVRCGKHWGGKIEYDDFVKWKSATAKTICANCGATEPGGAWYHSGDTWLCAKCSPYANKKDYGNCAVCGQQLTGPGWRYIGNPEQSVCDRCSGEYSTTARKGKFDCPRCNREQIVKVNGGAWCLGCNTKWATAEEFHAEAGGDSQAEPQRWPPAKYRQILRERFHRLTRRLAEDELDILDERLKDIEAEFSANWDLRERR